MDEGEHHRARLGFIMMSTDLAGESDFFRMAPKGVGIHITRLKTEDHTTNETLARHIEHMADAASRIQPDMKPEVISYSCTSGSIVIGEKRVMAEIKKGAPWTRPMCLVTGVVDALRELGAQKLVVGTPYLDEVNTAEAEFLLEKGFEVLDIQGLNLSTGTEMGQVTPDYWKEFGVAIDQTGCRCDLLELRRHTLAGSRRADRRSHRQAGHHLQPGPVLELPALRRHQR